MARSPPGDTPHEKPSNRTTAFSAVLLIVSLVAVVLLAKVLSYPLDRFIATAGLPQAIVGVVIAAVVLLPEGIRGREGSPPQPSAEQHKLGARFRLGQHRANNPDGRCRIIAPGTKARFGTDAGKYGSFVANAVRQYADAGDWTNECSAGCGSSRYIYCIHSVGGGPMKTLIQGSANAIELVSKTDR